MLRRNLIAMFAVATITLGANAESISGNILIKKRLTRKSVTAEVPVYQRGTAVKLGKDDGDNDPLGVERTRVVIYLEGPAAPQAKDAAPVQVEQINRRFSPELVVIPAGTSVSFPNMDPIFHNIFSLSKAKSFDLGNYDKGDSRTVLFSKPGIVEVYCHLHPNMAATVVVTPNRWYARVDRSGQYQIPDVPPGEYTVVAWHKAAGFFRKTIVVGADHDGVADFFIPIGDEPKPGYASGESSAGGGAKR
jgi:plastocyanin